MASGILHLMGKKYSYEILNTISNMSNARFKDLRRVCPIERMRTQRLKELEESGMIKSSVMKLGRRPTQTERKHGKNT